MVEVLSSRNKYVQLETRHNNFLKNKLRNSGFEDKIVGINLFANGSIDRSTFAFRYTTINNI